MSFLGEIKRRKVFHVAAVYLVVAWLIMQVVDVVSGPLLLPDVFARIVIVVLAIGFPITVLISWAFDITPEGVVRDAGADKQPRSGSRKIEYVLFGALALAVGFMFVDNYVFRETDQSPVVQEVTTTVESIEETLSPVTAEVPREVLENSVAVRPGQNRSPDPDNA